MMSGKDGTSPSQSEIRRKISEGEMKVARLIAQGIDPLTAHQTIYPRSHHARSIRKRLSHIFRSEETMGVIKKGVEDAAGKLGITRESILQRFKDESESQKNKGSTRVAANKELAKILDVYPDETPKLPTGEIPLAQLIKAKEVKAIEGRNAENGEDGTEEPQGEDGETIDGGVDNGGGETEHPEPLDPDNSGLE